MRFLGIFVLIVLGETSLVRSDDEVRLEETVAASALDSRLIGLIEDPRLVRLKVLLSNATVPLPIPLELLDVGRRQSKTLGPRIVVAGSGDDRLVAVEVLARPETNEAFLPDELRTAECVFVFDCRGQLISLLGGKSRRVRRTSVSQDRVDILRLGPEEDWFVRVMNSGDEPLESHTEFHRLSEDVIPSIRYFHHMNSNSWSYGPELRTARYGKLGFDLPKVADKLQPGEGGLTDTGRLLPPQIVWDGDRNRFVGATTQFVRDQPLYAVDREWSQEFEPLSPIPDQLVVSGGREDGEDWLNAYNFAVAIPEGNGGMIVLSIPQPNGPPQIIQKQLKPGLAYLSIKLDSIDNESTTQMTLSVARTEKVFARSKPTFTIPFPLDGDVLGRLPIVRTLDSGEAAQLLSRPLAGTPMPLMLDIVNADMGKTGI
ncbi:MAG: hypothetical protein ACK5Q5_09860 [Planctomycetaceae bacterium]